MCILLEYKSVLWITGELVRTHLQTNTVFSAFNTLYPTNHFIKEPESNQDKNKKPSFPKKDIYMLTSILLLKTYRSLQVSRALKITVNIVRGKSYANGFQTNEENNNPISSGKLK